MSSRVLILMSLVWTNIYSRSITSNSENFRKSRQVDFGECCPCPKSEDVTSDPIVFEPDLSGADGCPCRNRGPELEAASSILSPALQMLRPFIRPHDMKKEPEPLLKPEVGLASSVLETLQEVTNEEYENALARDAVRSVARALETDLPLRQSPDSPGSIINIILNPKETGSDLEVVPEASHVQETRCIHSSLGSARDYGIKKFKPSLLPEPRHDLQILRTNSKTHFSDMENGASNVQNSLQKPSNSYVVGNLYEKLNQNEYSDNLQKEKVFLKDPIGETFDNGHSNFDISKRLRKVPDLKLSTFVNNIKKSIESNPILNQYPKKKINVPKPNKITPISTSFSEQPSLSQKLTNTLKPLILRNNENPMKLKNLLKLKDVELIPLKQLNNNNNNKINNVESSEKSIIDNETLMNASVEEDYNIKYNKTCLESENLDTVPSSTNIKTSNTNLESGLLHPSHILNNREKANTFETIIPSITSTVSVLNLADKSSQYNLVQEGDIPATEGISVENESNDRSSKTSDSQILSINSEETDNGILKNGIQNGSPFIRNINRIQNIQKSEKNMLPLIRADIIKSFNNFKKVNDDMQEKLRQNLQNVLQVADTDKTNAVDDEMSVQQTKALNKIDSKLGSNEIDIDKKSVTIEDLQKMGDSILNVSNMKDKSILTTASNQRLTESIETFEGKSESHIQDNIENDPKKCFSSENFTENSLEKKSNKTVTLLDKPNEFVGSSITQHGGLYDNSNNSNILSSTQYNNDLVELDINCSKNGTPCLIDEKALKVTEDKTLVREGKTFDKLLVKNKEDMVTKNINNKIPENYVGTGNLLTNPNNTNWAINHDETDCIDINYNEMSGQGSEPVTNPVSSSQPNSIQVVCSDETAGTYKHINDMSVQASERIANRVSTSQPDLSQVISSNEINCIDIHSNEMSVQASEPTVNRASFMQIDKNLHKFDQDRKPNYSLSSALRPFSAKITSPNTLHRDRLNQNLHSKQESTNVNNNKHEYNNLEKFFKKVDISEKMPRLEKKKHVLFSGSSHGFDLSDDLKRKPNSLNNLKKGLGINKNINRKQSHNLYRDVLKNAEDFREYFSKSHNKFNDRLQELTMDWNERIKSITERADNLERSTFNRPANARKNSLLSSQDKTPTLNYSKKRTNNRLTQGRPESFTNVFSQETFKPFQLSAIPLNENSNLGKSKLSLPTFTTTKRPASIFSLNNSQKKGKLLLDPPSKSSQAVRKVMGLQSNKPSNLKRLDSKTLSSNIDPVAIKKQSNIQRLRSQSCESIEKEHRPASSEGVNPELSSRNINALSSSSRDSVSKNDMPPQQKSEDYSLLGKLIDRIRSSQSISSTNRNSDDHGYDENLQPPSQNTKEIKMAQNTLKENTSYKCKMICTKDKK